MAESVSLVLGEGEKIIAWPTYIYSHNYHIRHFVMMSCLT